MQFEHRAACDTEVWVTFSCIRGWLQAIRDRMCTHECANHDAVVVSREVSMLNEYAPFTNPFMGFNFRRTRVPVGLLIFRNLPLKIRGILKLSAGVWPKLPRYNFRGMPLMPYFAWLLQPNKLHTAWRCLEAPRS